MLKKFLEELTTVNTTPVLLNIYNDICPLLDVPGNDKIRLENLRDYLNSLLEKKPKIMIVGESAGFNGAKRTGLHLLTQTYFQSRITGISTISKTQEKESNTAKTIDQVFTNKEVPLAFNIVPFFTHSKDNFKANRAPNKTEIQNYSHFAEMLYQIFHPEKVVAMGRLAEYGLNYRNIKNEYVRHPSMGGKQEFINTMKTILGE